jgi:hypothetical protein
MQSQESMFEKSEPTPAQPINTDPREQQQRQDMPSAEGDGETYQEYSEGYAGPYGEPWQMEGEKIRPHQRPRGKRRSIARPLVVLLLIIALAIGWSGLSPMRFHGGERALPAQTFNVTGAPTLVVNGGGGSVHIHAGNTGSVLVSARQEGFGRSNDDGSPVKTEMDGNTIDVSTTGNSGFFMGNDQVDLDITVPVASNLEIHTRSGDVSIEGVNGQITLNTTSGNIEGDNLNGVFTVNTDSGDVELQHILLQGDSSFKSNNGKIAVQGDLDPQGNYQFQTSSGDVKLTLPEHALFHLTPATNSGDVENGFEHTQDGNGPGPTLNISTDSGNITVQPQDD